MTNPDPNREERIARARELRDAGSSFQEIARVLGCSKTTAANLLRNSPWACEDCGNRTKGGSVCQACAVARNRRLRGVWGWSMTSTLPDGYVVRSDRFSGESLDEFLERHREMVRWALVQRCQASWSGPIVRRRGVLPRRAAA